MDGQAVFKQGGMYVLLLTFTDLVCKADVVVVVVVVVAVVVFVVVFCGGEGFKKKS